MWATMVLLTVHFIEYINLLPILAMEDIEVLSSHRI